MTMVQANAVLASYPFHGMESMLTKCLDAWLKELLMLHMNKLSLLNQEMISTSISNVWLMWLISSKLDLLLLSLFLPLFIEHI
jgi:hypothetical protein